MGTELAQFPGYARDAKGDVSRGEFAAFSPYGHWLATTHEHTVSLRSPRDGSEQFSWEPDSPYGQRIMALRFDPNGNTLFAFLEHAKPTKHPTTKFWQYDIDRHEAWQFDGTHGVVDGCATPDGKYVVTWDGSPEIVFWDLAEHTEIAAVKVASEHVYDVALSPKGDVIATAGDDGEVKFWNVADRTRIETQHPYKHSGIDLVQFYWEGKYLITGSDDGWLKQWDAPEFCWDPQEIPKCEFGVNGEPLALTERFSDGRVRVTHTDGNVIETFPDGTVKKYKHQ